jgi:hypothetical protein
MCGNRHHPHEWLCETTTSRVRPLPTQSGGRQKGPTKERSFGVQKLDKQGWIVDGRLMQRGEAGRDPQLEKAVRLAMGALKELVKSRALKNSLVYLHC